MRIHDLDEKGLNESPNKSGSCCSGVQALVPCSTKVGRDKAKTAQGFVRFGSHPILMTLIE